MTRVPRAHLEAQHRLAATQDALQAAYQHARNRTLRALDTPARIQLRLNRLLQTPSIASALEASGVAEEFRTRSPDQLSPTAQSRLERIIGGSDFMPSWFLTRGAELRRTVARVRARARNEEEAYGTGFLVGPRLLLTNRHVLDWSDNGKQPLDEIAPYSFAEFDFEKQADGVMMELATFRLDPATLLLTSPWNLLDYVLIAVQPVDCARQARRIEEFGHNRLAGDQGKISKGEAVYIIQHPEGMPKMVVLRDNRVIERSEDSAYLHYTADTEVGSSGSPVYNQQWEIVALHHAPQIARDHDVILTPDGTPWAPEMGSAKIKYLELNEGIRISFILRDLATKRESIRKDPAALAAPERCTGEGLALLDATLQFQRGASPAALSAPTQVAAASAPPRIPPSTGHFARPD